MGREDVIGKDLKELETSKEGVNWEVLNKRLDERASVLVLGGSVLWWIVGINSVVLTYQKTSINIWAKKIWAKLNGHEKTWKEK